MTRKAIDGLVNVHFGETEKQPTWMLKVRDDYFKGPESMFAPVDLSELIDEMDEQGVRKAILMDSISYVDAEDAGHVAVCASHGGASSAEYARLS